MQFKSARLFRLAFSMMPLWAAEIPKVEALPAGGFEISPVLQQHGYSPFQVQWVTIRGSRFFFLVSRGPTVENAALLITDLNGRGVWFHPLVKQELSDWAVSPNGESYAILFADLQNHEQIVQTFSVDGAELSRVAVAGDPVFLAYIHGRFVGIETSGGGELAKSRLASSVGLKSLISLPADRIAIVSETSCEIEIVDTASGTVSRPQIPGTKIIPKSLGTQGPFTNALVAVTADENGSLYLLPEFNPLRETAPVLVLDSNSLEQRTILCHLPPLARGRPMIPMDIAASASELVFVGIDGHVELFDFRN